MSKSTTGNISIHTENIFPIIKKWLYSEKEIFIRELLSNATDAMTKYAKLAVHDKSITPPKTPQITLSVDDKKKTLTISDNGIGMTAEEIQKYINQIAFSGAEEFVEKFKDDKEQSDIIGHFGLGFYSAFMVAKTVEIDSLSYQDGATSAKWSCDGSTEFSISEGSRTEIGTDIILHLDKDNQEFTNADTVKDLVKKYANFLPVEIKLGDDIINDQNPIWIKAPTELKDEDYKAFYQKLYPMSPEPLFWIHLSVDYPFNLKGILYFPKLLHELDSQKGQVSLYCQQVFVSDHAKEILPEFLTLLQGAIDCPDFPLNVSRSMLQNDPYVQKISKHIVKKVADKLNQLFKKDKANFESYWEDISPFIKYGMMQHDDFYKKVSDIVMFKSSADCSTTIPEYLERNNEKLGKTVLYATNKDTHATYVNLCKEQGLEVIYLATVIDTHFIGFLESKDSEVKYKSVDSDLDGLLTTKVEDKSADDIKTLFESQITQEGVTIKAESLKSDAISAMILESEEMKRLKQMSAMMGNKAAFPSTLTLVVNASSPVIQKILAKSKVSTDNPDIKLMCEEVFDLAKMAQQPLAGDDLQAFITRTNEFLAKIV